MAEEQDNQPSEQQKKKLNDFYLKHFGYDFGSLTPEKKALLDQALDAVSKANGPTQVAYNGKIVPNTARQQLMDNGGLKANDAALLGAYGQYKAGIMPDALDRERLAKAKVPADQIDRMENERLGNFVKSANSQFANLVVPDENTKPSKENAIKTTDLEPDEITAEPQETVNRDGVDIPMPKASEKAAFEKWLKANNVKDPFNQAQHYDNVGAFRAGEGRAGGPEGHFTDQFKLPGHPTFSNESQYATGDNARYAGSWDANGNFIPPQAPMEKLPSYSPGDELPKPNQNIWRNYILVPRLKKPGGI